MINTFYGCIDRRETYTGTEFELVAGENDELESEYDFSDCLCALENELDDIRCKTVEHWWRELLDGFSNRINVRDFLHGAIMFIDSDLACSTDELTFLKSILRNEVYKNDV